MRTKPASTPLKLARNVLTMQVIFTGIGCILLFFGFLAFDIDFPGVLLYAAPFGLLACSAILVAYFQLSALEAEHRAANQVGASDH